MVLWEMSMVNGVMGNVNDKWCYWKCQWEMVLWEMVLWEMVIWEMVLWKISIQKGKC